MRAQLTLLLILWGGSLWAQPGNDTTATDLDTIRLEMEPINTSSPKTIENVGLEVKDAVDKNDSKEVAEISSLSSVNLEGLRQRYDECPKFESSEVPEKWAKESIVILYQEFHDTYNRNDKGSIIHEQSRRRRLKLQDQRAVQEFSSFHYIAEIDAGRDASIFDLSNRFTIQKADGSKIEVDLTGNNEDVTELPDFFRNTGLKGTFRKCAIADLEPGDIIEYEYAFAEKLSGKTTFFDRSFDFLADSYPIVAQAYLFRYDGNFELNYNITPSSLPTLTENLPSEGPMEESPLKMILFDQDREALKDLRWDYSFRSNKVLRRQMVHKLKVEKDRNGNGHDYSGGPSTYLIQNTDLEKVGISITQGNRGAIDLKIQKKALKHIQKNYSKDWRESRPSALEKARVWYRTHRDFYFADYNHQNDQDMSLMEFYRGFEAFGKMYSVDVDLTMISPRGLGPEGQAITYAEYWFMVQVGSLNNWMFLHSPDRISRFEDARHQFNSSEYSHYQEPTTLYYSYGYNGTYDYGKILIANAINWEDPTFHKQDSKGVINLQLDSLRSEFVMEEKISGRYRSTELNRLGYLEPGTFQEKRPKGGKKLIEYERLQKARKESSRRRLERVRRDHIENNFDLHDLTNCELVELGQSIDNKPIEIKETYEVEGLLHPAGEDYIFDLGKIIGGQIGLENDEYERDVDVWMDYPRQLKYKFTIAIPEGYQVEGIDKLRSRIDNEYNHFHVNLTEEGQNLIVDIEKTYKTYTVPEEEWPEMTRFLDLAWEFTQQKVLLKKMN